MERKRSVRRPKRRKTWARKCKDLCRQFIAFMFSNVGIIGLVVSYTIAGAFLFRNIEGQYHMLMLLDVNKTRSEMAAKFWNMTIDLNPFVEHEYKMAIEMQILDYQKKVIKWVQYGYDGSSNDYSAKWSFAGAFLFSLTVITTIGYGNISPHTMKGKIATIIYAIIGMPLFLLYLSNIGDILARSFKWIYANCCLCRWCPGVARRRAERRRRRRAQYRQNSVVGNVDFCNQRNSITSVEGNEEIDDDDDDDEEDYYDFETVTVPITICLAIMVGYVCGGAMLFCKWEEWKFLDASYFCFISLSTIGFGDLVPGDKIYGHSKDIVGEVLELRFIFCSMYLMLGMALIAMCFNLMQEEVIHKIRTTVRTVKYILRCNSR